MYIFIFNFSIVFSNTNCEDVFDTVIGDLRDLAEKAIGRNDWWGVDGTRGENSYEDQFKKLLGSSNTFFDWVKKRKQSGKSSHVLDLFGSGAFINDFAYTDSITAVRLLDVSVPGLVEASKRSVIQGSIFEKETLKKLKQNLQSRGIKEIDLITIRPVGAFSSFLEKNRENSAAISIFHGLYYSLIKDAYELLTANEGEMYISTPIGYPSFLETIVKTLGKMNVMALINENKKAIKITRTSSSTNVLPDIKF